MENYDCTRANETKERGKRFGVQPMLVREQAENVMISPAWQIRSIYTISEQRPSTRKLGKHSNIRTPFSFLLPALTSSCIWPIIPVT